MGGEPSADTHDVVYLVKRSAYEIRLIVPKTSPPFLAQREPSFRRVLARGTGPRDRL
jgi:hypothetical protein